MAARKRRINTDNRMRIGCRSKDIFYDLKGEARDEYILYVLFETKKLTPLEKQFGIKFGEKFGEKFGRNSG